MVILVNFGERIKELRMSKGLSLRELGSKLNIDYSTLGHYESGRRRPDFDTLVKLADYFDVSIDYLLVRTNDPSGEDELPKKVYKIRMNLGKSQEEFAQMVNLTPDEVKAIEEGRLEEEKRWRAWISLVVGGFYERGIAKPKGDFKTVPILGKVCAGNGFPAKEQILGFDIDPTGQADFILEVSGNSMSPLINNKERVYVKWQNFADDVDIVVAFINGNDGVVRRFRRFDHVVVLEPENREAAEEIIINLKDNPSWGIIGIILGKFQSFKK